MSVVPAIHIRIERATGTIRHANEALEKLQLAAREATAAINDFNAIQALERAARSTATAIKRTEAHRRRLQRKALRAQSVPFRSE